MDVGMEEFVIEAIRKCGGSGLAVTDIGRQMLLSDLQLDSLGILELVYELEDHFAVTIDAKALSNLERIDDIVHMIAAAVLKAA